MNLNAVSLRRLFPAAEFVNCEDVIVSQVCADSRKVASGDVFVAVRGATHDGHRFTNDAIAAGARSIVTEHRLHDLALPQCIVPDTAEAFAKISMMQHCGGASAVTSAGLTGTNGKTTTTYMLRSILQQAGLQTGLVGTIESSDGHTTTRSSMTTPDAATLAAHYGQMRSHGTSHCVLEVSSHALDQQRCAGIRLSAAAITNVTQDHFDYHKSADAYLQAKARISSLLYPDAPLLINRDDANSRKLQGLLPAATPVVTFGIDSPEAELRAEVLSKTHRSQRIHLCLAQGSSEVRLRLIGHHNVSNSLVAAGLAEQLGISLKHIVAGLEAIHCVPGRLERIDVGQPFQVIVDYAHTPDALARCISTVRNFVPGRLICVFGAGGDRDASKRPMMGDAANDVDLAIVTSDNPRSESPHEIIRQIARGFSAQLTYLTEPDRRQAIARAFDAAEPGDVVLIVGKGHEGTQEIQGQSIPFDDRDVARELLREAESDGMLASLPPVFSLPKSA